MPSLKCPHCSRVLKIGEDAAGKRITCPACKKQFLAPKPPAGAGEPPPVKSADRPWHLHVDGRTVGPFSADGVAEQLKAKKIDGTTLAWKEGLDDWTPLRELDEFRKAARGAKPVGKGEGAGEHERRRRYVPGKSKREVIMGAWIAAGLAAVLIIVILIVVHMPRPEERAERDKRQPAVRVVEPAGPAPQPPATPAAPRPATPAKKPPRIIKRKKPKISNEQLIAKVTKDVDQLFQQAFANPQKAEIKPIFKLMTQCKKHAAELKARNWDSYQRDVEKYASMLEQTATGIHSQLKLLSQKWHPDVGYDANEIARDFLADIAFLRRWHANINEALAEVSKRGLTVEPSKLRALPAPPKATKPPRPKPPPKPEPDEPEEQG